MAKDKFLVDTHCLIWFQESNPKLSFKANNIIKNIDNIILFSQISLFEIAIKESLGKMPYFKSSIDEVYQQAMKDNFTALQIQNNYLESYIKLPSFDSHKDPFDRLIIATAIIENAAIITIDDKFRLYSDLVEIIW